MPEKCSGRVQGGHAKHRTRPGGVCEEHRSTCRRAARPVELIERIQLVAMTLEYACDDVCGLLLISDAPSSKLVLADKRLVIRDQSRKHVPQLLIVQVRRAGIGQTQPGNAVKGVDHLRKPRPVFLTRLYDILHDLEIPDRQMRDERGRLDKPSRKAALLERQQFVKNGYDRVFVHY